MNLFFDFPSEAFLFECCARKGVILGLADAAR